MDERLLKVLESAEGFDAVLITCPTQKRYLTDFESDDAGVLVITAKGAWFIIDGRYFEAAEKQVKIPVVLQNRPFEQLKSLLSGCKRVAVQRGMTLAELEHYKEQLSNFELAPCRSLDIAIDNMRRIKTSQEIDSITAAQRIAEKAFNHLLGFIREGVTDIEIAAELEYVMRRGGAEAISFNTIAVSGANSSVPHGVPTPKKVAAGDFITMDFGAVVNGCHSDMTRTVAVGYVTERMRKVYNTVLAAQEAALNGIAAGVPCKEIDALARSVIESTGFGQYFTHSTGHGVGYEIHEAPTLSARSEQILTAGDVVTVEPGIYLPSEFGVRIEDMALVTQKGCKNLTKSPKELIIV